MYAMLLLNFICPFVMILVGNILRKRPVSDMRKQNGYNTPTSRKSQAHWDYAQQIAPDIFIRFGKYLGIAEVVVSIILFLMQISVERSLIIGEGIGFICLFYTFYYTFYYTDGKIKDKFSNEKKVEL